MVEEQTVDKQGKQVSENEKPEELQANDLEKKNLALEESLKKEKDSYLRLRAEFDNYRKRMALEQEDFTKYAASNFILEVLPILDSFERAQKSFEKHKDEVDEIIKGTALIHKQFEDILKKMGVEKIDCLGKSFDPNLHEAVMQQESADKEENTILEEVQPGYMLQGRMLRHAMVIVSKQSPSTKSQ
ncbi:MAG: nucleotide exchange factor GrpE [Candidatus Margulisbacteria bacterium]|nr:nucleotide exchange factor GrpE [Candidatus Margulisiibacteriota bacterium]